MPVVKRTVEPTHLCRQPLPAKCADDLQHNVVNSLCGLITQLAAIARHADDIFEEVRVGGEAAERWGEGIGKTISQEEDDIWRVRAAEIFGNGRCGNCYERKQRLGAAQVIRRGLAEGEGAGNVMGGGGWQ